MKVEITVKAEISISKDEKYCGNECSYNSGNFCYLFDCDLESNPQSFRYCNIRCKQCINSEVTK
jgi:hypothetical protein